MKYFKAFNDTSKTACDKYHYHEGLNIYPGKFDPNDKLNGGCLFHDQNIIMNEVSNKTKIAEITVPDGEDIITFEKGKGCLGLRYKSQTVIVGKIMNIHDVETLKNLKNLCVNFENISPCLLWDCIELGKIDVIKYLMEEKIYNNEDLARGIGYAIRSNQLEVTKYIIETLNGFDVESLWFLYVEQGVVHNAFDTIKFLSDCGYDLHKHGDQLLRTAVFHGKFKMAKYLHSQGLSIFKSIFIYGFVRFFYFIFKHFIGPIFMSIIAIVCTIIFSIPVSIILSFSHED